MKIVIATDAWLPQVNGVVRTYENVTRELESLGHRLMLISHEGFNTFPCPTYPSIRLAFLPGRVIRNKLESFRPDAIHVATEGPLGFATRSYCMKRSLPFTTSFHTQLPEYINLRASIPTSWLYKIARSFHGKAIRTMVPTDNQKDRLEKHGFKNTVIWSRGVNTEVFRPADKLFLDLTRPVFTYAGRVAVEKNIEAFLELELPGSKLVVGDGPDLRMLKAKYPETMFTGFKFGEELAAHLSASDVFIFPSLTDTFGVVMLEAMACGLPVAAFPVTGPIDVVKNGVTGILDQDLETAAMQALKLDPQDCINYAGTYTWRNSAEMFLNNLAPINYTS